MLRLKRPRAKTNPWVGIVLVLVGIGVLVAVTVVRCERAYALAHKEASSGWGYSTLLVINDEFLGGTVLLETWGSPDTIAYRYQIFILRSLERYESTPSEFDLAGPHTVRFGADRKNIWLMDRDGNESGPYPADFREFDTDIPYLDDMPQVSYVELLQTRELLGLSDAAFGTETIIWPNVRPLMIRVIKSTMLDTGLPLLACIVAVLFVRELFAFTMRYTSSRCIKCGYTLHTDATTCSECGTPRQDATA
ncbi:MAG: hypothetical protein AAF432_01145 [Planctomycetota bacterium]